VTSIEQPLILGALGREPARRSRFEADPEAKGAEGHQGLRWGAGLGGPPRSVGDGLRRAV
jgi:hypothetical protein